MDVQKTIEAMQALSQLQSLDLQIDALRKKKEDLPRRLKALEDAATKDQQRLDQALLKKEEQEKAIRQSASAIEMQKERLTRGQSKFESASNNKEYQAGQKELDQVKKLLTQLEQKQEKYKKDSDAIDSELAHIRLGLEQTLQQRNQAMSEMKEESEGFEGRILALSQERNRHVQVVGKTVVTRYDRVRQARQGVGVVPIEGGRCTGCNVTVPPQMYNEIQKLQDLAACPNCHRFFVVPDKIGHA